MRNRARSSCEKLRSARQNQVISGSEAFQPASLQTSQTLASDACQLHSLRSILELIHVDCGDARDQHWHSQYG